MSLRVLSFGFFLAFLLMNIPLAYPATYKDLVEAVKRKDVNRVEDLLEQEEIKKLVNTCDNRDGRTLLHRAARKNLDKIAELLLAAGADPRLLDDNNLTALNLAINGRYVEVVDAILECHPFLVGTERHPDTNLTPLQIAIYGGESNLPLIRALIEQHSAPVAEEDIRIAKSLEYNAIRSYLQLKRNGQRSISSNLQSRGLVVISQSSNPPRRKLGSFIRIILPFFGGK